MSQERKFDAEQMTELLDRHDYKRLKEELESVHLSTLWMPLMIWIKRSGSLSSGFWQRKRRRKCVYGHGQRHA